MLCQTPEAQAEQWASIKAQRAVECPGYDSKPAADAQQPAMSHLVAAEPVLSTETLEPSIDSAAEARQAPTDEQQSAVLKIQVQNLTL